MNTPNASPQIAIQTNEQAYQISAWKAFSVVAGAVLVSIVGTAFAFVRTAQSDHYLLISNTERILAIESTAVRQDVLVEQLAPIKSDLAEIKLDVRELLKNERK